ASPYFRTACLYSGPNCSWSLRERRRHSRAINPSAINMITRIPAKITIVVVFTFNLRATTRYLHLVKFNSQSCEHLRVKKRERVPIYLILDLMVAVAVSAVELPNVRMPQRDIWVRAEPV